MQALRHTPTSAVMIALALLTAAHLAAQTPTYAVLYSFQVGADGSGPNGVTLGKSGALYGTTYTGGKNTCSTQTQYYLCGTVFELAPSTAGAWTKTVLHSFSGPDGARPSPQIIEDVPGPSLVFGSSGALYGTTEVGGSNDPAGTGPAGTVFELAPPATAGEAWAETVLYSLSGSGEAPHTPNGVLIDPSGAVYTTAVASYFSKGVGVAGGAVFKLTPPAEPGGTWTESTTG